MTEYEYTEKLPPRYEAYLSQFPGLEACRVCLQEKGLVRILTPSGARWARVSGRFRHETLTVSDYPVVGDWVMADTRGGGEAVIHAVLPRKSAVLRRAAGTEKTEQAVAANIDTLFICMALTRDFSLRRLERCLAVAWESGATPAVVLTKADLCDGLAEKTALAESVAVGSDVVAVSSFEGDGWRRLEPWLLPGRTVAFIGSSGVGKSTLINRLMGEEILDTGSVGTTGRGRHTTTRRQLITLQSGASVIDTPGMREIGMWDAGEGLSSAFADIVELAGRCRFRDCTHRSEPGCAVREALEKGELTEERWASYLKLMSENAYCEDAEGYLRAKNEKFMKIAMYSRARRKKGQ